ncbi:hypothetical protein COCSADRAFT_346138 [Bipolaris sorokiniana ND90Pr]|uniref:Uncharacterized protein n=1 Tax=Cochliobolus sativus (strain ND90Pr / ATCC 201652) TaxID=665912 RepID=M2S0G1_COCSN|nr:uncharacterized protein COCSADRAFT_346138 [Bipolaris sorokiniana ND90Pr]EMD60743.1 hypothetical protein COCSADRAFT_346138 [Bipolaris sorokiniana ND90Pr]
MVRQNEPVQEQELSEILCGSATTGLLDSEIPRLKRALPLNEPNSRYRDFFKHIGLQLPDYIGRSAFSWRSTKEHPKVATYKSRRMAALNSLLHFVPLSGALVLVVLFWTQYWIGGNSDNATSLQFAAKLHEMLMQASLVDILLYVIRFQATSGYIPLGALSGAAKAPQLSYLWSLDFFSAILSPAFSARRKAAFILSTSGLLLMTAVVGPSSAVLMIPRPDMPHINRTVIRYSNVTESSLFPVHIDNHTAGGVMNITRLDEITRFSYVDINTADKIPADGYSWSSDLDLRFGQFFRTAYQVYLNLASNVDIKIATIPTMLSALRLLKNSPVYGYREDIDGTYRSRAKSVNTRWTSYTSQPVVMVKCSSVQSAKDIENVYYIRDDNSRSPLHGAANLLGPYLSKYANRINLNMSTIPLLWMTSPDSSKNLLLVYLDPEEGSWLEICTIAAFWHKITTTMVLLNSDAIIQTRLLEGEEYWKKSSMTEIIIDPVFVSSLGPPCTNTHGNPTLNLALCFVAALSWIPSIKHDAYKGYNRFELNDSSTLSTFELVETINGYGYGATNTSIRLSVAVMLTYCIITIVYVSYIIITGHTSIAWDSATELIMLAIQSKEPPGLGHISVGLDSMETFRKCVGIRVSTQGHDSTGEPVEKLELVFEDDEEAKKRGLLKIERGKAY